MLSVVLGKTTNSQLGTTGGKEGTRENRRVQLLMFMVIRVARAINVGVLVPEASVRCMRSAQPFLFVPLDDTNG